MKIFTAALVLVSLFLFVGCDTSNSDSNAPFVTHRWSGETMGTYYRVTVVEGAEANQHRFDITTAKQRVEQQLDAIIASMSTYISDSEISVFNALAANTCLPVSQSLLALVQLSIKMNTASAGAFNPLVGPLVERWGFGRSTDAFVYPNKSEIKRLLSRADISSLSVDNDNQALCKSADIALDLSAIAKGYAVDQVAKQLEALSVANYLVDIGGEVAVSGHNPQGGNWRLAIEKPVFRAGEIQQIVELDNMAIATSGDYRNFFEHQGKRYSHTIDVRTGYPVQHNLASVSVIADSAAEADAWATALNVMGPEEAKQLAVEQKLAVFLITRENTLKPDNDNASAFAAKRSIWYSEAFYRFMSE